MTILTPPTRSFPAMSPQPDLDDDELELELDLKPVLFTSLVATSRVPLKEEVSFEVPLKAASALTIPLPAAFAEAPEIAVAFVFNRLFILLAVSVLLSCRSEATTPAT